MELDIIHDRRPLEVLTPEVFDRYLEKGWRILGYSILRHSAVLYQDEVVLTIPLRIRLDGFTFSKSQRKLLTANKMRFRTLLKPITITAEKNEIFLRHCMRFRSGNHYHHVNTFITEESWRLPVEGLEIEVYDEDQLIACSFFHLGEKSFCGTYCFFEPEYQKFSLGNYTLLLELEIAMQMGKEFYYSGYIHHKPSQFDYKLNFNNLEKYSWIRSEWAAQERVLAGSK
jgi:arginyl-tRNA--protein-N-Asp/Glu arginylyltransferase